MLDIIYLLVTPQPHKPDEGNVCSIHTQKCIMFGEIALFLWCHILKYDNLLDKFNIYLYYILLYMTRYGQS